MTTFPLGATEGGHVACRTLTECATLRQRPAPERQQNATPARQVRQEPADVHEESLFELIDEFERRCDRHATGPEEPVSHDHRKSPQSCRTDLKPVHGGHAANINAALVTCADCRYMRRRALWPGGADAKSTPECDHGHQVAGRDLTQELHYYTKFNTKPNSPKEGA